MTGDFSETFSSSFYPVHSSKPSKGFVLNLDINNDNTKVLLKGKTEFRNQKCYATTNSERIFSVAVQLIGIGFFHTNNLA